MTENAAFQTIQEHLPRDGMVIITGPDFSFDGREELRRLPDLGYTLSDGELIAWRAPRRG